MGCECRACVILSRAPTAQSVRTSVETKSNLKKGISGCCFYLIFEFSHTTESWQCCHLVLLRSVE